VVAELSPEIVVLAAVPEVVSVVAEPEVFALGFAAAELSPEIVVLAAVPEVVSVVELEVSEPGVVFVAVVSVADVAGPQASVDTPVVFDVLLPVSVAVVGVDSSGRPKFLAFPNVGHYAISSSSVEVGGEECSHSSTGGHTNHDACSILSSLGLHQNKNLEHGCNKPIPGHSNASDTNHPPMDATTNHSRKTNPALYQEQRKHRVYQGSQLLQEAQEMR
jgi:hypothetical protein